MSARKDDPADDLLWLRGQVFSLCEATEDSAFAELEKPNLTEHEKGYHRGRGMEAKGIRRTIGEVVRMRMRIAERRS